jgi:tRNA pseudouridine55 synthase
VERAARTVAVSRFATRPDPQRPGVFQAEVVCSSGTYVRVLAQDLGRALGGGAHVTNLRRTGIGSFGGSEMRPLAELGTEDLLTPAEALRDLEAISVGEELALQVRTGLPLDKVPLGAAGEGPWPVLDGEGRLLAVYEATDTDRIRPAVVVAPR